jgi:DNA primase
MLKTKIKLRFPKLNFPVLDPNKPFFKGNIVAIYEKLTNNPVLKTGKTYMGLCPFHEEDTPSLALYPETASAYCFGCSWNGDSIKMVMLLKKCSFQEALDYIKQNG